LNTTQKGPPDKCTQNTVKVLDEDAWRRAPLFGENPRKGFDPEVLYMMQVALGPGFGVGNRDRILRDAIAFSNAATSAFKLSLGATAGRWKQAATALHEALETALASSAEKNPGHLNVGWFVYSRMGLMLNDLLPDRSNHNGPSDRFCMPANDVEKFERSPWHKKLRKYCPPEVWKRDPEMFFRLAENYRRISNECYRQLPKRTRNEGRPANPERVALLKWVQAQGLEPKPLSVQLKKWCRQLVVFGGYPRGDMPPFADKRNADGTWLYLTEADHAEALAQWWDRRTELTYKRMRDVLKSKEKDAKRAERKKRAHQ
jgi:hypothetical protein